MHENVLSKQHQGFGEAHWVHIIPAMKWVCWLSVALNTCFVSSCIHQRNVPVFRFNCIIELQSHFIELNSRLNILLQSYYIFNTPKLKTNSNDNHIKTLFVNTTRFQLERFTQKEFDLWTAAMFNIELLHKTLTVFIEQKTIVLIKRVRFCYWQSRYLCIFG